ncbi:MAG: hypothetical protein RLZZ350_2050 [Verrucomicrobiota bacterium]|jgi:hypothetical protein
MKDNRSAEKFATSVDAADGAVANESHTMKIKLTFLALALAASATPLLAQDGGQRPPSDQRQPPPIIAALDANHDGTIDAGEIANASAALKTLDKNGDGKLTSDELRPAQGQAGRPPGGQGQDGPPPQQ